MTSEMPVPLSPAVPPILATQGPSPELAPPLALPVLVEPPAAPERLHRALAVLTAERTGRDRTWREALLAEFELRLLEGAMLERELDATRRWLVGRAIGETIAGADEYGFDGPVGTNDGRQPTVRSVHEWIASASTLDDLRWILAQEAAARPDEALPGPAAGATFAIEPNRAMAAPTEPCWEALAVRNLLIGLTASPWHQDVARGANQAAEAWNRQIASCIGAAVERLHPDLPPIPAMSCSASPVEANLANQPNGRTVVPASDAALLGRASFVRARLALHARYAERMLSSMQAQTDARELRPG